MSSQRAERRIAMIRPPPGGGGKAAQAVQLLESMLWAFQGTLRSNWIAASVDVADVVAVYGGARDEERVAGWRQRGKELIALLVANEAPLAGEYWGSPRPIAELAWFAGCHASLRLAPWLDTKASFRITRWPNFGLIRPMPSQIRAVALLATGALMAEQLAASRPARVNAEMPQPPGGLKSFLKLVRKRLGLSGAS